MHAMHTQTMKSKLLASDQAFRIFLSGLSMGEELLHAVLRHAVLGVALGPAPCLIAQQRTAV